MTSISAQDILFDDFALLEPHIGRQHLIATSVNANCDCASSPSLNADHNSLSDPTISHHDDRHPNQITSFAGQAS